MVNIIRVQFDSTYTCRHLFRVGLLATRRQEKLHAFINRYPWIVCSGNKDSQTKTPTAIGRSKHVKAKGARSRDGLSGQKARDSSIYIGQGDLIEIKVTHIEHVTSTSAIV